MMSALLAYVPDLMDRSRLGELGDTITFVSTAPDLAGAADGDTVIVDLGRSGAIEAAAAAAQRGARVIGFASHVDDELLRSAETAGIHAVPRSRFFKQFAELLG